MLQKNIVPWGHGQFLRGSLSPSPMTQSCYVAESSGRCACIWPAIVQAHKESKLLLINTRALCNCLLFHGQWQSGRTDFPFPWYGMAIRRNKTFMVLVPIVLDLPHLKQKKKKKEEELSNSSGNSLSTIVIGGKLMWVIHRNLSCWILGKWRG